MSKPIKLLFSAGGTGGHIIPALAVAEAVKNKWPDTEIHFAGALGKMEMEKVPAKGYQITGLPIQGLQRSITAKNLKFPVQLIKSLLMANRLIKDFQPDAVAGFGGYASAPVLKTAQWKGLPTFIQEQNAFPGITNRWLARHADVIFTAYEGMGKYFPSSKIQISGNPIRQDFFNLPESKKESRKHFGLDPDWPVVFLMGGSQGARAINHAVAHHIEYFIRNKIQLIWQTGKFYFDEAKEIISKHNAEDTIKPYIFIDEIHRAYSAATIMVARAGAISIAEISAAGKACIFVPLPTAAENHQYKNAMKLVNHKAADIIQNNELKERLRGKIESLINNPGHIKEIEQNIQTFARPGASEKIAATIMKQIMQSDD